MNEQMIIVLAGVLIVAALVLLLKTKYKTQAAEMLLYLVTKAEQELGGGTGQLKYSAVSLWLYERLPSIAKLLLSAKLIDSLIEDAVERMQSYLEVNGKAREIVEGGNNK